MASIEIKDLNPTIQDARSALKSIEKPSPITLPVSTKRVEELKYLVKQSDNLEKLV